MGPIDPRDRISAQFAEASERADIWRLFDLVLETDAFLNLGYSPWYLPHVVGSSQRRLSGQVGDRLASRLRETRGRPLLDVGCGRGGPAIHLSTRFGFDVTGVDLVRYNVARGTRNARERGDDTGFAVGDATALPIEPGRMAACTAIDSLVYVPDRAGALAEMAAALAPDGVAVVTDLVTAGGLGAPERRSVGAFADAWDMPPLQSVGEYRAQFADVGLELRSIETITAHSVGRFRTWTTLALGLLDSPVGTFVDRLLRRRGLDPTTIRRQVRGAHEALPDLEHVLFVARA